MSNFSEDHYKLRPYHGSITTLHSYVASPVLTASRQRPRGSHSDLPKPFLQSTFNYTRHTDVFLIPLPSFLPSLLLNCTLSWQSGTTRRQSLSPNCQKLHFHSQGDTQLRNIRCNQHSLRAEHSDYSFNLKTGCIEQQGCTDQETAGTAT